MSKSIMQTKKECYICRKLVGPGLELTDKGLEEHHALFGKGLRPIADKAGLVVWLCHKHHRTGEHAVHKDMFQREILRMEAQMRYEETHSREEWMEMVGESYL